MADFPDIPIVLPAPSIYPGDLMARAMDKLHTVHLALAPDNKGWRDEDTMDAVWATLEQAIRGLEPVRARLQGAMSQDLIAEIRRAEAARSVSNKQT